MQTLSYTDTVIECECGNKTVVVVFKVLNCGREGDVFVSDKNWLKCHNIKLLLIRPLYASV